MNCKKCGALLTGDDKFCKSCGATVEQTIAQNNITGIQPNFTLNEMNNFQQPVQQPVNNFQQPVQQPVNNFQQPVMQNSPQIMMNNQQQKNNNLKFILIGVGIVAVIAVILIIVLVGNRKEEGTNNENTSVVDNTVQTYSVDFKGFNFKIPTNIIYKTQVDSIALTNKENTWSVCIEILDGSFNSLLARKDELHTTFQNLGYEAAPAVEKTIGGMKFIVLEVNVSGTNALLGLSKANSSYVFGITAYDINNEFDYEILETMSSILKSAEHTGNVNQVSVFESIDMSSISALAK